MNRKPKLMNFLQMRNILEPHINEMREHVLINNEMAVIHGNAEFFKFIIQQNPPFIIDDHRLGYINKGEARININLVERHLTAGTIAFLGPGTIINPVNISKDFEIYGIGLFSDFPMPFTQNQMPLAFNGQIRDFQLQVDSAEIETTRSIINLIWHMTHQPDYNHQAICSLVATLMYHYDRLYKIYSDRMQSSMSREQTIFDRFIYLVNKYCHKEHQIKFYSDKMCLTERYLGTIIHNASGSTAKEWIDRALVTRIKAELRHSDKTTVQIADEMGFPNPAFFCKYFKRNTGMTPLQFKKT